MFRLACCVWTTASNRGLCNMYVLHRQAGMPRLTCHVAERDQDTVQHSCNAEQGCHAYTDLLCRHQWQYGTRRLQMCRLLKISGYPVHP